MATALLTTYLSPYRIPLYARLAERHDLEVLCFGGGERYVPPWFADLDHQLASAPFAARRATLAEIARIGRRYDSVIGPFAGGPILPAAYAGARRFRRPFVLWASVWTQPRSAVHALALPITNHIYRNADAVIAYGEHTRRFVASIRGTDADVFVAPQSVEPELFGREVAWHEVEAFRTRHGLPPAPIVLYAGRLVTEKGVGVLLEAWREVKNEATLVLIGDGPLAGSALHSPKTRLLGPLPRTDLPVAYAAAEVALLPSIPTPRFCEPWGLVCNEAMHQGRPVIATATVGAVAGGLVRDGETGLVVAPRDPHALRRAIDRLLVDAPLRTRLGSNAKSAVSGYTYAAMVDAFDRALALAISRSESRGHGRSRYRGHA